MEAMGMEKLNQIVSAVDSFVWGPVMLVFLKCGHLFYIAYQ